MILSSNPSSGMIMISPWAFRSIRHSSCSWQKSKKSSSLKSRGGRSVTRSNVSISMTTRSTAGAVIVAISYKYRSDRSALEHRVFLNHAAVEMRAELRCALLRRIIHVIETEAQAVAISPFEVVHQAPQKIAAHGEIFRHGPMQTDKVIAQVHDAVCIPDVSVGRKHVGGRAAVFGDVHLLHVPDLAQMPWRPVQRFRSDVQPRRRHMRIRRRRRHDGKSRRGLLSPNISRRVDVHAHEIQGAADDLQI